MNNAKFFIILTLLCNVSFGSAQFLDYVKSVGTYFGYGKDVEQSIYSNHLDQSVPYEVSVSDEKFISEAAKLTGVALSELDSCQHRVVLKLQTTCDRMNDEQLAKMAVMLLNCQSAVEGRKIYPCNDNMSIKDCTLSMDADTWNSYHLMSNRARAVCYSVRQIQFRSLTEHTVNRLMNSARNQLSTLDKIAKDQEDLHNTAVESLTSISEGQKRLVAQQKDMEQVQLYGQLAIEDNIQRLVDEKRMILETHNQLTQMTLSLQDKLDAASSHLQTYANENRINHQEVLDDLIAIQNKAQVIFQRIEDSAQLLLKQSIAAHEQYKVTLAQLAEVNTTVHSLVVLVSGTRKAVEERLIWINTTLGGTDLAIERLGEILWHVAYLMLLMLSCAFLGARTLTRLTVTVLPSMNLVLTLQKNSYALDPFELLFAISSLIFAQTIIFSLMAIWESKIPQKAIPWVKQKLTPRRNNLPPTDLAENECYNYNSEETDDFNFSSPITSYEKTYSSLPRARSRTPLNLNGAKKGTCGAKTRVGTPCKLSSLPGRQFCYRHQSGDSVFAS